MFNGLFIVVTIGNVLSLVVFFFIYREIKKITQDQIYVIGEENKKLVKGVGMKILSTAYFISTIGLVGFSYYLIA